MSTAANPGTSESPGPDIDATIVQVEKLYRLLSGKEPPPPNGPYAAIPPEKDPTRHVEEQIERLATLLSQPASIAAAAAASWTPPLSIWEAESETVLRLDVPGVSRERIDVRLEANAITVTGERATTQRVESGGRNEPRLVWNEAQMGRFQRVIPLTGSPESDPSAQLRDGVLEIRIRHSVRVERGPKAIQVS